MEQALVQTEVIESQSVALDVVRWNAKAIEAEQLANSIVIVDDDSNVLAVDCLSKIKAFGKEVEAERTSTVGPFNNLVTRINNIFKPISASITGAEGVIKKKMLVYAEKKESDRRIEEARIRKENEEREHKAREEHEAALKAAQEEAARTATPVVAPVYVAPSAVVPPKPVTTSTGYIGKSNVTKTWKGEPVAPMEIIKAIAAGTVPISVVEFRPAELNKYAKQIGIEGVWTGIKVSEQKGIASR